jgi:hypothetical protein
MGLLSLIGSITLNNSQFTSKLKESQTLAGKAGQNIGDAMKRNIAGALGGLGIFNELRKAVQYASEIADKSARLDIDTTSLQEIDFGAQMAGSSLEALGPVFNALAKARKAAMKDVAGEEAVSFRSLGVSIADLKSKRLEDLFFQIGHSLKDASDGQQLFADGLKVLGKSGGDVVQMFRAGMPEAVEHFRKLGIAISPEAVKRLDDYGDKWSELGFKIRSAASVAADGASRLHGVLAGVIDRTSTLMNILLVPSKDLKGGSGSKLTELAMFFGAKEGSRRGMEFKRGDGLGGFKSPSLESVMAGDFDKGDQSNQQIGRLIQLQEKLNEAKFQQLTDTQKRVALLKQIEEFEIRIALIKAGRFLGLGGNELLLGQQAEMQAAKAKLFGIENQNQPANKKRSMFTDSLSEIGNFLGQSTNTPQMRILSEQHKTLKDIERNTKQKSKGLDVPL